jgi:cell division septation protein DedD
MPKNTERPGELVLENRHLLLIFFAIVALSGVFFALGYIVGRNTLSSSASTGLAETESTASGARPSPMPPAAYYLRATPPPAAPVAEDPEAVPPELQFDRTLGGQAPDARLESPEAAAAAPPAVAAAAPRPSQPPGTVPMPPGILVQVSALTRQQDAETLVQLLREKNLPVMVTAGIADALFHVVIGPYQTDADAQQVKRLLEEDGFQPIIKR